MSLKLKAINGGKWLTVSTVFQTVIQFVQIAVLARLLDPVVFGIVAISNLIIAFFGIFANLGFTNSIIHNQESDRKILSTVYFLNILLGVALFLIVQVTSPFIVSFYDEPRLIKVIGYSSFVFLFVYFGSIHTILLKKELQFKFVALIDIFGNLIGSAITIYLAYSGYEELSLVYGGLVMHICRTLLEIYFGRWLFRPTWHFKPREVKDHLKFGMYNFGENFVNYIQSNWDNIIIGKIVGPKYLGIYSLAMQLAVYPIVKLNPLILQVVYPVIAKIKDDEALFKRAYLKVIELLSYLNFPLLAGLYVMVESVVPLFYGAGWEETFPLVRIFVFVSAIGCLTHPLFTLAYSKGKPKYMFYLNLVNFSVKVPLVYLFGNVWGVIGVAYALVLSSAIHLFLNFIITQMLIKDYFISMMKELGKPILFCIIMTLAVQVYKNWVGYEGWGHAIAEICIGALVYLSLVLTFKYSLTDLKELRKAL
ncbi:MOP flippase family protein [Parapedobacter sp. DT-150]|uniref:MOP flippase family protein n=1 Tax=Parapedobacter sp. DT-150 TaxID=3396162 RepID=UPI003F1C04BC